MWGIAVVLCIAECLLAPRRLGSTKSECNGGIDQSMRLV